MRHEAATFGKKKKNTNPEISVIIFWGLFLLFQQQKTPKLAETPIFYSVLANLKREVSTF